MIKINEVNVLYYSLRGKSYLLFDANN